MNDLKAGIYRHYKGPLYLVLGLAHDANSDEFTFYDEARIPETDIERAFSDGREVVVYVGLQLDAAHTGARLAVRTLEDFFAQVCVKQGCAHYGEKLISGTYRTCVNGGHGYPRFEYVGARYVAEMS